MNLALSTLMGKRTRSVETLSDDRGSSHSDSTEEVLDIQGDQFNENKEEVSNLNLSSYDMWALGLTTAIGGHYFAWNAGLTVGFGSFVIALFLIATGYVSLVLCIAELSSALPFAGGAYGIARVTLGIFPGYLVAVCDSYKSIIYVSTAVFSIGQIITIASELHADLAYLYWALFLCLYLSVLSYGGRFFWRINVLLASLSVTLLLIYIFGAIRFADFEKNASLPGEEGTARWFHGGAYEFVSVLPLATRFYQGIQSINLACGQIKNPKKEVPKGYVGAMSTVFITSFAVLFIATSVKPGLDLFVIRPRPLSNGFKQMFAMPPLRATLLNLPATIMAGFGFMYYYGQQISAMGKSGLLNPKFGWELPGRNTPVVALVVGSAFGYMLCVIQHIYPDTADQIYSLSILGAVFTYLSIFASFCMFRWYFPTIKREFTSPLGMYGAAYGAVVFLLCFISVCGFQKDRVAIIVFVIIVAVASIYYYFVVRKRQVFSEEEKTVMFKAYLMKNNAAKAGRIRRGGGHAPTGSASAGSSGAGSSAGSNAARGKKTTARLMSRIEVGPAPGTGAENSGGYGSSPPATTPTSTTILVPYRPVDTSPVEVRTPAGSRRGSANDISAAVNSPADGGDIETGLRPAEDSGGDHSTGSQNLETVYPGAENNIGVNNFENNPQRSFRSAR